MSDIIESQQLQEAPKLIAALVDARLTGNRVLECETSQRLDHDFHILLGFADKL